MAHARTFYGKPVEKSEQITVATARTPGQLRRAGEKFTWWEGYRTACAVERREQVEQNTVRSLWKLAGAALGVVSAIALYPACTELFAGDGGIVAKQGGELVTQMAKAWLPVAALACVSRFCFSRAKRLER